VAPQSASNAPRAASSIKRSQSHLNHILTKKSTKRKRHLRNQEIVKPADEKTLRRLMPYS